MWTSVLVTRITRVWKDLRILHPSQYGYQPKVGTDTELLQLLNIIEDAQEHKKPVLMTSYDTAKAFDSVNKPFMEAAWQRLGVPLDIARYLVQMDVQGDTIIKTPHSTHVRKKYGTSAFTSNERSTRTSAPSFRARDGIGQGDSPSATAWVAVYDVLLHALDSVPSSYKFSIQDHQIQTVVSLAYADDLQTISPDPKHAQQVMDIVSAFNCVTGFTLQVKKTSCGSNQPITLGNITIRDKDWLPHTILIQPNFQIPVLGITLDLTNRWTVLQHEIRTAIKSLTKPLIRKRQTTLTKYLAYKMVVIHSPETRRSGYSKHGTFSAQV